VVLSQRQASGLEYLQLVTTLLQGARRATPTGGLWEAADFQWWWRRDQHGESARQVFWLDHDTPAAAAAVIITDWGTHFGCEVIAPDLGHADVLVAAWPAALGQMGKIARPVEMTIRDDDLALIDAATAAGFEATGEVAVSTWMPAAARPNQTRLEDGFKLAARSDAPTRPHHMIQRSGPQVAERLGECSLYRPELDLAVYAPNGEVAAYGLFWPDPVTEVGLVEPMRTEDKYQGMGLARHVLAAGLDRLAELGCSRLKVTYIVGNEASRRLYLGAGFRPDSTSRTYRRRQPRT
jgi:RimJ/RimL family protein N-acetyltransferase